MHIYIYIERERESARARARERERVRERESTVFPARWAPCVRGTQRQSSCPPPHAKTRLTLPPGAKRQHLKRVRALVPESQGQNLALTVTIYVPYSMLALTVHRCATFARDSGQEQPKPRRKSSCPPPHAKTRLTLPPG